MMRRLFSVLLVTVILTGLVACASNTPGSGRHDIAGRGLSKTHPDSLSERRIVLVYPPTKERLDVTYVHKGNYDRDALDKINRLMRDRHANVVGEIDPELIDYMIDIRTRLGLPATIPFQILSGYRTRETNTMLARNNKNVALESTHLHGWAVDFRVDHVDGRAICEIAKTMQRGGVAYYPRDNHVHIDLGNIRTWHEKS